MITMTWIPVEREYSLAKSNTSVHSSRRERAFVNPLLSAKRKAEVTQQQQQSHPQKATTKKSSTSNKTQQVELGDDPLSNLLLNPSPPGLKSSSPTPTTTAARTSLFQKPISKWKQFTERTKTEFTISGKVKVEVDFLKSNYKEEKKKHKSVALSKSKMRLEHLEQRNATSQSSSGEPYRVSLSQKEYTDRIARLHSGLKTAWNRNERVQALKIAIQCSKLLADQSVPQYYPSLWAQVIEILDTFGDLVFQRIKTLGSSKRERSESLLGNNWTTSDVPEDARETCRNWFFKISCIRELLPRIYIEMALMRCYRFLSDSEFPVILGRLSNVIRGIGDPLIAIYARAYLVHMDSRIWGDYSLSLLKVAAHKKQLFSSLYDYLFTTREFKRRRKGAICTDHGLTEDQYDRIHAPALDWILSVLGEEANREEWDQIMSKYEQNPSSELMFGLILSNFPPRHYSSSALSIVRKIKASTSSTPTTKAKLFAKLAQGLITSPPVEEDKIPLLNEVWRVVGKLNKPEEIGAYVECAASFIELTLKHYSEVEVLVLLKHLLTRLDGVRGCTIKEDGDDKKQQQDNVDFACIAPQLERICNAMCEGSRDDFGAILTNEYLMRLLDMFKSERKTILCKSLLTTFIKFTKTTGDPVVIHAVFALARDLHDSVDSLTFGDEKRQVSMLICGFIERIDFGRDFEQHFNVLVDCRASFPNLDFVKDRLVIAVASLAMKTNKVVHGRHSKRTLTFVKSCIAYCHITIPSIEDVFKRMTLFQLCGQVALANNLLPQTDTLFKHAIMTVLQVPATAPVDRGFFAYSKNVNRKEVSTEPRLVQLLRNLLSCLVPVPGHHQDGGNQPFVLINGLLEAISNYPHWNPETGAKTKLRIGVLQLLAGYGQRRRLPIEVRGVESNNTLFNADEGYTEELHGLIESVVGEILEDLSAFNELKLAAVKKEKEGLLQMNCVLILDFINTVLVCFRIDNVEVFKLVKKMLDLLHCDLESLKPDQRSSFQTKMFGKIRKYYENTGLFVKRLFNEGRLQLNETRAGQAAAYEKLLEKFSEV